MSIVRFKTMPDQRLGNDSIYGSGYDGDYVVSGTFVMNRDYFFNNLTLENNAVLVTNGYRLFVKDTLKANAGSKIGLPSSYTGVNTFGTLIGRASNTTPGISKTYILGDGASAGSVPQAILNDLNFVIRGWHYDPTSGFKRVEAGDDGAKGADVAGQAGFPAPAAPSGGDGGAGGAGGAGGNAPAPANPGNPGNPGTAGNPGNPGTQGDPGNPGATGIGGDGGEGGGNVFVIAKNITGSGTILSEGRVGYVGATGTPGTQGAAGTAGTAGTDGSFGNPGNAGNKYPAQHTASSTNPTQQVVSGHNQSNPITQTNYHSIPGNPIYAQAHSPGTPQHGAHCYTLHNPPTQGVALRSNHHHNFHNDGYKQWYHNIGIRSNAHHQTHRPGTEYQVCDPVPHNSPSNHQYVSGYNPEGTGSSTQTVGHNPSTKNYTTVPGNTNPSVHTPEIPGGNAGPRGNRGAAGNAGAAGVGGLGGAGGTGETGTAGLYGGVVIVCDSIEAGVSTTNAGHSTVLINA